MGRSEGGSAVGAESGAVWGAGSRLSVGQWDCGLEDWRLAVVQDVVTNSHFSIRLGQLEPRSWNEIRSPEGIDPLARRVSPSLLAALPSLSCWGSTPLCCSCRRYSLQAR